MAYCAFTIDDGHITMPSHAFDAADDGSAIKYAQQFVDACDVEVWDDDRFVALIGPERVKPRA
jgi:hypothetical protein